MMNDFRWARPASRPLLAGLLMACGSLHAATPPDPAAVQRLDQESLERQQRERRLEQSAPVAPSITVPQQPAAQTRGEESVRNIPVRGFEVDASELLTPAEIAQALAPYEARAVSFQELLQAVEKLNALYASKGIRTARAILPAQDIKDGMVRIRLIEARLGKVEVAGTQYLAPDFVRERLRQESGELLSVAQLESDLIRFNTLYAARLRADVMAGAQIGQTDITVEVQEPQPVSLTTFADDAGREATGKERVGAVLRVNNMLGRSDSLQWLASRSRGASSYGLSYSLPINRNDLRLDANYSYGSIHLISGPFEPLDITGSSRDMGFGLTQPLVVDLDRQWSVYGRFSDRRSISRFGGVTQQNQNLHVLAFGVSGEARNDSRAWAMDHGVYTGIREFGGDAHFSYYRGSFSRFDRFSSRWSLVTRAGLQLAFSKLLPTGEQFQLGGLYSVRGFAEGLLTGRNGYFGSIELRSLIHAPAPGASPRSGPTVQGLVFLDHGAAFPYRPGQKNTEDDYLSSAGIGLIMDFGSRVSARVTLARPLRANPADPDSDSPRIHAGLNIAWF